MKKIKLTQGKYALVDNEDFESLNQFKWFYADGEGNRQGYAVRSVYQGKNSNPKTIKMHRVILKVKLATEFCDHINNDKLDNRKSNLRIATRSQNGINRLKFFTQRMTSIYKGVYYDKSGKGRWRALIRKNNKNINIGSFKTEKEAASAYNNLAKKHFGDFAFLNQLT